MKKEFLSLKEAADRLGVGERSMYRFIHGGELKAYKIRYWRIKEKDLAAFIEGRAKKFRGKTK